MTHVKTCVPLNERAGEIGYVGKRTSICIWHTSFDMICVSLWDRVLLITAVSLLMYICLRMLSSSPLI